MKSEFSAVPSVKRLPSHSLIILVNEGLKLGDFAKSLDKEFNGVIKTALKNNPRFTGDKDEQLLITAPKGCSATRIVLMGVGDVKQVTDFQAYAWGGRALRLVQDTGEKAVTIVLDALDHCDIAVGMAAGARLKAYRFDTYKSDLTDEEKPSHRHIIIATRHKTDAVKHYKRHEAIVTGMITARTMGNEPPNVMTPARCAMIIQKLRYPNLKIRVLQASQLKSLGMGALMGVAQGSHNTPHVVIMEYRGSRNKKSAPVALIGKGVTFDTGGINIKQFAGMWDMKFDMQGASAIVGAMQSLAIRKAKVNAVALLGFVENMPSGHSYRPGDILTSYSGKTIEIQNTDAEGRLVLCDLLSYAQKIFKPKAMIDAATLTGAAIAALGHEFGALFASHDDFANDLLEAGKKTGDRLWRLPLDAGYDRQLNSEFADMRNIGVQGEAGASTAAHFLKRFVKDSTPWAHLDIAGVAWSYSNMALTSQKGATGFGVRLLDQLIYERFES